MTVVAAMAAFFAFRATTAESEMDRMSNPPTYKTTDVVRAAIVLAQGIPLIDALSSKFELCFVFDDTDGKATLAAAAYVHNTKIGLTDLSNALRRTQEFQYLHRTISGRPAEPLNLKELLRVSRTKPKEKITCPTNKSSEPPTPTEQQS